MGILWDPAMTFRAGWKVLTNELYSVSDTADGSMRVPRRDQFLRESLASDPSTIDPADGRTERGQCDGR